jgi:hypothetical protein
MVSPLKSTKSNAYAAEQGKLRGILLTTELTLVGRSLVAARKRWLALGRF